MNFLAHCSLAHDAAEVWQCSEQERIGLLAGAVIGDFVKGPIPTDWPTPLRAGARLHRKVDALSNLNPAIRTNCNRFPTHLRRLAPIFVDLLADHCLSLNWQTHYDMEIEYFSQTCYAALEEYAQFQNPNAQALSQYMRNVDLLASYDEWPHVRRGIKSVLRRLRQEGLLEEVETASLATLAGTHTDFATYYPDLRQAWHSWNAFDAIAAPQNS